MKTYLISKTIIYILTAPLWGAAPSAVVNEKIVLNSFKTPHSFKYFRRVMRIPNMCLVSKLVNGKVVSIANGQNYRITDGQNHRTTQYRISI